MCNTHTHTHATFRPKPDACVTHRKCSGRKWAAEDGCRPNSSPWWYSNDPFMGHANPIGRDPCDRNRSGWASWLAAENGTFGTSQIECSVPLRSSALDNSMTFHPDISTISGPALPWYLIWYQLSHRLNPHQTPPDGSHEYVPNQFQRITRKDCGNLERFKWDSGQPVEV